MNKEQQLLQIYNTLFLIETHGDNTLLMANCLMALKNIINNNSITNGDENVITE